MLFWKSKLILLVLNWSFSPFSCSGTLTACPSNAFSCPVSTRSQRRVSHTWWSVVESCPGNAQQGKLSWILAPHAQGQNDGKAPSCIKIAKCFWLWGRWDEGEQSLSPLLCCCPFSLPAGLPCSQSGRACLFLGLRCLLTTSWPLQLWERLSPPSVCCPGCLLTWQRSPKADPICSLQTEGELGEADITSQSQRAQAAPGAAQQSAGPDLLALPSPTLKLVTARPRLVANSDTQATEEEGE